MATGGDELAAVRGGSRRSDWTLIAALAEELRAVRAYDDGAARLFVPDPPVVDDDQLALFPTESIGTPAPASWPAAGVQGGTR